MVDATVAQHVPVYPSVVIKVAHVAVDHVELDRYQPLGPFFMEGAEAGASTALEKQRVG